jgi:cellulose biosynthesis protein BcsQ
MKIILIASAKGGSGKTTVAVRLAEQAAARGFRSIVIDLSAYPAASLIAAKNVRVLAARTATTPHAVRATLKPLASTTDIAFIDTGRLSDPILDNWLPLVHAHLLLLETTPQAIASLPALWKMIENAKRANPETQFPGFVVAQLKDKQQDLRRQIQRRFPEHFFPEAIPFSEIEPLVAQSGCYTLPLIERGLDATPYARILDRVCTLTKLVPPAAAESTETKGILGKLWGLAKNVLGTPRVQTTGAR